MCDGSPGAGGRARPESRRRRQRARRRIGALALAGLVATLAGPLVLPAFDADEAAVFCCREGRCCCDPRTVGDAGGECLKRACGCSRPGAATIVLPLRLPAVLVDAVALVGPGASALVPPAPPPVPLVRSSPPALPPPRLLPSA